MKISRKYRKPSALKARRQALSFLEITPSPLPTLALTSVSNQFLLLLLGPDIVRVISEPLRHVLHLSRQRQVGHVYRVRIVVERRC